MARAKENPIEAAHRHWPTGAKSPPGTGGMLTEEEPELPRAYVMASAQVGSSGWGVSPPAHRAALESRPRVALSSGGAGSEMSSSYAYLAVSFTRATWNRTATILLPCRRV